MTSTKKRSLAIFIVCAFILSVIFFVFPINIFDGQIDYLEPQREYTINTQLSLSYFIGLGYDEADMEFVEAFRLTMKGWLTAIIFIFGLPGLLAYRISMKKKKQ